ncbi:cytosolic carboxypeptidase 6 isoform X2 [Lingula anatina]|uniref:Cytosolic carboxypeptidase 6 n=1 Tax=Lingula anatina TaxID=7574 RepID=A0A1S3JGN5_LINAN|nr:cytosolic carboxypeptidase 6 isoform X2 [Lingula anatina]XP_013409060.1 cytosolic carboxypeptidase 6 isoform X2 [Lingula anatina]|eukprot:XP_013409059.1 cytosolic carboxypeptidase 6 isoform X2 [Lingula anatina]
MADKKPDSGSDSESADEPVVGNVNKFAVVPPGYSGRPKKGHLIFDACFESGNLGRVDFITDYEYDLFIRPDTCNPRFRVWFNFTVENVKADQRVIFNIVNFSKTKSLYREGMTPLVKSTSRPKWVRIPTKHVYYYRCPDHRKNYVMSFAFCFDKETDVYQFSYCYPYSYTRLQNYLDNIEKRNLDFVQRELVALSVQQRRLDLLVITNPENLEPEEKQKVVFLTARVHPGETPASYVCQGIIDFLISSHPIAKILRDHLVFKIVPMLNPDGVYLGNYRCSLMGFDLNRHWMEPSPWAHPTLYATKNLLLEMDRNENVEVDFYIDIHAHSTLMNGFMYGNVYDDSGKFEKHAIFPKLLDQNAEDFSLNNTNFNRDSVKAGTGRRTLGGCLDESHCYTLEVSFFSYLTNGASTALPYTEEAYMKLGRNLARTFLDYYKLTGFISAKPSSSIVPKPGRHSAKDRNKAERAASEPLRYSQEER